MSTPTFEDSTPLDLDEVARRLEEATPERTFQTAARHSWKWACEIEHDGLAVAKINKCRSHIKDHAYWKREVEYLKTAFADVVFENLRKQNSTDSTSPSPDWQRMAVSYRRRLARQGVDSKKLHAFRRCSIPEGPYWRRETECFKRFAAMQANGPPDKRQATTTSRSQRKSRPETHQFKPHTPRQLRSSRVGKLASPGGRR